MKILLTGGSGMVGKNILNHHRSSDYNFLTPSRNELDLLDKSSVLVYLQTNLPDTVIHCAGKVGGIQANILKPVSFLYENMMMGMNIIESSNSVGIPNLINMGSSCMYPRNAPNPLSEDQILTGELEPTNEGYAIAKISCSKLCNYIVKENSARNYKTLIPCNLYGKYDNFDPIKSHLIPAIIVKISDAIKNNINEVEIWGDGASRREFMYAEDLASFVFNFIDKIEELPGLINVGLGKDYSIRNYYDEISKIMNFSGKFTYDLNKPQGMKQKLIDTKQSALLGWRARTSLKDGLTQTIEYYQSEILN